MIIDGTQKVCELFDQWHWKCLNLPKGSRQVPRCWRSAELREVQAAARRLILEIEELSGMLPEDERDGRPLGRIE